MTEPTIGDNSAIDVDVDELLSWLNDIEDKNKTVTEARGKVGALVKEVLTDTGWNKAAFQDIRKIHGKSETARADYLRTFSALFDAMMSEFWEGEMKDLIDQLEAENCA